MTNLLCSDENGICRSTFQNNSLRLDFKSKSLILCVYLEER